MADTKQSSRIGRGYFGIGIERGKDKANIGTLWRSAYSLGASFIFTIGRRYPKQATDTSQAWRHIPLLEFKDVDDFNEHRPFDCQLIGVELHPASVPLEAFKHPQRAVYLLGPEDGSLSPQAASLCQSIVQFKSTYCLNVASAGTIVMYDRQTKGPPP
jgi:tRNA G18 (ribose-2'-O)-methylase SpoU